MALFLLLVGVMALAWGYRMRRRGGSSPKVQGHAAKRALAEAMGFRYEPERGLPPEEVRASGLFPAFDRYEGEGLVTGSVMAELRWLLFAASEVRLYREVEAGGGERYQKLFEGTLYRFTLPFPVEGEVRLEERKGRGEAEGSARRRPLLSLFARWLPARRRASRSPRGSPEFGDLFEVHDGDGPEAKRLLTSSFQQALVSLRERMGNPVRVAVKGDTLWVAVEGKRSFELPSRPLAQEEASTYACRLKRELEEVAWAAEVLSFEEATRRGLLREFKETEPLGPVAKGAFVPLC